MCQQDISITWQQNQCLVINLFHISLLPLQGSSIAIAKFPECRYVTPETPQMYSSVGTHNCYQAKAPYLVKS